MSHRIHRWDRKYRVKDPAAAARLDGLATPVLAAFEAAVRAVTTDPDEVLLVRDVHARIVVLAGDADPARVWGQAMATAFLRRLATAEADTVARFPNRAAHLAEFLLAVLDDRAADHWSFARFATHRRPTASETLADALLANSDLAAAVLRHVRDRGKLPQLLQALGHHTRRVWVEAVVGSATPPPAAERPIFAAAVRILERLAGESFASVAVEGWFATFLATPRPDTDWTDRTHLAEAVVHAVRFLLARCPLALPLAVPVAEAVAAFDWLDIAWLTNGIEAALATPLPLVPLATPATPIRATSPRQRQWIEALRVALTPPPPGWEESDLASPANALLAYTAVTTRHPDWADDAALPQFLEFLLTTPATRVRDLLGPAAEDVVRTLAKTATPSPRAPIDTFETPAAGIFLLLRTVHDLRLAALAERVKFPAGGAKFLLAALAARWAGQPLGPRFDPLLAAFADLDEPAWDAAADPWAVDPEQADRWQALLVRVLLGQGLLAGTAPLCVVRVPVGDGSMAFAGDEAAQLWPFAIRLDTPTIPAEHIANWQATWLELSGSRHEFPVIEAPATLVRSVGSLIDPSAADATRQAGFVAAAQVVLRAWARWLPGMDRSSPAYLLEQFIRRPGRVRRTGDRLVVELEPRPLDVVLQLNGHLEPLHPVPGVPGRTVEFQRSRAR